MSAIPPPEWALGASLDREPEPEPPQRPMFPPPPWSAPWREPEIDLVTALPVPLPPLERFQPPAPDWRQEEREQLALARGQHVEPAVVEEAPSPYPPPARLSA